MSNKRLPNFVRGVTIQNSHYKRFTPALANWAELHPFLRDEELTSRHLQVMIRMEYERAPGPRAHILKRLVGRFNKVRRDEEWNEMIDCYNAYEARL